MIKINYKILLLLVLQFLVVAIFAQEGPYAPAAGEEGSTAIHKDSSIIVSWATNCIVTRGYINIEDTTVTYTQAGVTSNHAFFGHDTLAIGYPDGTMTCVSLGDGGEAVLEFQKPIKNGDGPDFAVFENGFKSQQPPGLYFLELAFVEVSSDGVNFVRFPAVSRTSSETQIDGFGQLDPTNLYNFAGKYVVDYGTPFDLDDIADSTGIDLNNITHVKLVDVVGLINSEHSTYDSEGNFVNDPWPTPFWSCGFDLNGVGVINEGEVSNVVSDNILNSVMIFPNPVTNNENINIKITNKKAQEINKLIITDIYGRKVLVKDVKNKNILSLNSNGLLPGIYVLYINNKSGGIICAEKLIVK